MKFFNLLKKELAELINAQTIISLAVSLVMFMVLGQVMNSTIEEASKQEYTVNIIDQDHTDLTNALFDIMKENGAEINQYTTDSNDYSAILDTSGKDAMIIIPKGFTESIEKGESPEIISITAMESSAMMSNISNNNNGALGLISDCISKTFAEQSGMTTNDIELINSPLQISEHTVISNKSAEVNPDLLMTNLMTQNMILPIIVFVLIIMTSQMLMSAIANEKIDKTLETLLSTPIKRTSILGAKMLAAAIVALLNAVVFMFGFSFFMSGATDTVEIESTMSMQNISINDTLSDTLAQLGLTLNAGQYILVGVQLFLTIMICLCISLMLGALINDTKQAQTMIMPLMFMAMIPYMISMFADINTLPIVLRIIVYAIPFTHTFSAMSNLMFGHTFIFIGGLIYQTIAFAVCMFFALRLFKSDKILTASLNIGQKSKFRKNKNKENK